MEQPEMLQPDYAAIESLRIKLAEASLRKKTSDENFDKNFKPRGAIAFFILLVILGLIIWFGIYFLMLQRV
jgi:hypothetical protein